MSTRQIILGICQTRVSACERECLERAVSSVRQAASQGAQLAVLGEMFSTPYHVREFEPRARMIEAIGCKPQDSHVLRELSQVAQDLNVHIVCGSIPEREGDRIYNSSVVLNGEGVILARHRKVHLFDINIPASAHDPGFFFQESATLTAGSQVTSFQMLGIQIGLGICYDLRFPEYALKLSQTCELLLYPGAFNTTTGPAYWTQLAQGRAIDCQAFVALVSPARPDNEEDYPAYGHSLVRRPNGQLLTECGTQPETRVCTLNFQEVDLVRRSIPLRIQKRPEIYQ